MEIKAENIEKIDKKRIEEINKKIEEKITDDSLVFTYEINRLNGDLAIVIKNFSIKEENRGKGKGKEIFEEIKKIFSSYDEYNKFVIVQNNNYEFWKKMGFKRKENNKISLKQILVYLKNKKNLDKYKEDPDYISGNTVLKFKKNILKK